MSQQSGNNDPNRTGDTKGYLSAVKSEDANHLSMVQNSTKVNVSRLPVVWDRGISTVQKVFTCPAEKPCGYNTAQYKFACLQEDAILSHLASKHSVTPADKDNDQRLRNCEHKGCASSFYTEQGLQDHKWNDEH
ncbi:hypothetical protein GLAREA_04073 [Glarea lozoyensis ATCC 20868]|uniref:C2H2-type domain-containing protein n=1 Tax=Glarea lozoyensis (strain ATCC 20868 / MF5171) TaxID=1116229 RepID=S3DGF4_GLAL2|nr:uncharacterized protein GLAREA_04073 [Glarea lozoyensis ATCC 20868]EPE31106.1 hypothetical protein GLAREA_04073 [Glarea lozoyensis ATCC 20868]